jgi:hypothetical protein
MTPLRRTPRWSRAEWRGYRDTVPAVRVEGDDHVRLHVCNNPADGRFDVEHVNVRQGVRVVVPLALLARRVVESKQHRLLDAESRAREAEFLDAQRTQALDLSNRRVRFAGFAVCGTGERSTAQSG